MRPGFADSDMSSMVEGRIGCSSTKKTQEIEDGHERTELSSQGRNRLMAAKSNDSATESQKNM